MAGLAVIAKVFNPEYPENMEELENDYFSFFAKLKYPETDLGFIYRINDLK